MPKKIKDILGAWAPKPEKEKEFVDAHGEIDVQDPEKEKVEISAKKASTPADAKQLKEGHALIKKYSNEKGKMAKVYRDSEWNEYVVKHYKDGIHQHKADYHTDDKSDAHGTAKLFVKEGEEVVSELSHELLHRYLKKSSKDEVKQSKKGNFEKAEKRYSGQQMADRKIGDEFLSPPNVPAKKKAVNESEEKSEEKNNHHEKLRKRLENKIKKIDESIVLKETEELLSEGAATVQLNYAQRAKQTIMEINSLLDDIVIALENESTSSKTYYYPSFDIKYSSRQLEDIKDSLEINLENYNKNNGR